MFKLIKYFILLILVLVVIYFIKISFKNNAVEIKLKNPERIKDLKQKTIELKKEFTILNKQKNQKLPKQSDKEIRRTENKKALDIFIRQHSE